MCDMTSHDLHMSVAQVCVPWLIDMNVCAVTHW